MIAIYKNTVQDTKLRKVKNFDAKTWVAVTQPSESEIQKLSKKLSISEELLKDTVDPDELPRVEVEDGGLVVILRLPVKENDILLTKPITTILSDRHVTTITDGSVPLIEAMVAGKTNVVTTQQSNFLIKLSLRIIEQYQTYINAISKTVQSNKARLNTVQRTDVLRLMETEEVLNDFIAALTPTIAAIKRIISQNYMTLYQSDRDLIDDLLIDAEQVLESCITNLKTVRNIRDSYTTVMTLRLNQTLKVLTYITAFLTIPMLVASIYGMNVALPFAEQEHAFLIIMSITLGLIAVAILLFVQMRNRF